MNSDDAIDARIREHTDREEQASDNLQEYYGCVLRPTVKRYRSDDIEDAYDQKVSPKAEAVTAISTQQGTTKQ